MEMESGKRKRKKKRKERRSDAGKTEVIGIAGSGPGVGTTHFAILTANYLSGVLRRKTAVLEWNVSKDFERMEKICVGKAVSKQESHPFKVFEVSYMKSAGEKELLDCVNIGFDSVVIDFGSDTKTAEMKVLRCDRRFLVGSFCEWQAGAFTGLIAERSGKEGRWEYFYAFGSEEAAAQMQRQLHVFLKRIPESRDAFIITRELMAFFEGFLN